MQHFFLLILIFQIVKLIALDLHYYIVIIELLYLMYSKLEEFQTIHCSFSVPLKSKYVFII